jgi:hypothetical protein
MDQRFGLMGVELIGKKGPGGLLIGLNGLGDMSGEVGFGVCVGPMLGAITCPVATSKLAIKLWVPWRRYSNSWRST